MGRSVKRGYRSELRTAQARDTRRAIVEAAARLFVEVGYGATTLDAVAGAAGVSRKTVFTAVGGKFELLKTAMDWAVAGDDRPVAVSDRDDVRRYVEQHDPVVLVRGCVRTIVQINTRVAALTRALEVAAGVDPQARALDEDGRRRRLDDARVVAARLHSLGALTSDLTVDEAVDVIWLANDPGLFDRLVRIRGWSAERFGEWLGAALVRQLIRA